MRSTSVVFVMAWLALAPVVGAQEDSPLMVGTRVRLTAPGVVEGRLKGRVAAFDERSLTIEVDDRMPVRIRRDAITGLEMSTGRKRQALRGLMIGAAIGALVFGGILEVDPEACKFDDTVLCSRGEAIGMGTAVGAIYGAGIGAFVKSDRWAALTLNPSGLAPMARAPAVPSARPRPAGVSLGVSLRF